MNWFFLTLGYSGLFPKAPGTFGSFIALILGVAILFFLNEETLFYATVLITIVAIKAIDKHEAAVNTHDDKRIVIDELAGMWLALSIAPGSAVSWELINEFENGMIIQIVLSFLFFRLYDIKKPSYIGRIDRDVAGGMGVVGDDLLAGVAAGISAAIIWQGWLKLTTLI